MADDGKPVTTTNPTNPAGTGPAPSPTDAKPYVLPTNPKMYGPTISESQTYGDANALVAAFGKHDVKVELDTLTTFATKIEALLAAMDGSPAAPYKLEEQKLSQGSFVSGGSAHQFVEAVTLSSTYDKVHTQLVKLHKDFLSQIEAMKKAVTSTEGNYRTNEDQATADQNAVAKSSGVTGTTGPAGKNDL
ncbi:hypothetical protein ABT247_07195 [Kitasatospora sp. NPDC001539]|uniref:hypothetical protein n=1 Tax=Kitasatospora sp. NPDC001539 TaxID=3154384 RepID=UPI003332CF1B